MMIKKITIKKIILEEFVKHEKKIDEIIKLHLQSPNKHLDKISMDVIELGTVKNIIKKLASNMKESEKDLLDPNEVSEKLTELEGRLQRNNPCIHGLTENTNMTWDDSEKKVQEVLQDKLNIQDNLELDCCQHMGKQRRSRSQAQDIAK